MSSPGITGTNLLHELYRHRCAAAFALIVSLVLIRSTTTEEVLAQDRQAGKGTGSISGRVTIQGAPARGVIIGLFRDGNVLSNDPIARTETDTEGRFHLSAVQSNHYWLKVLSPNYVAPKGRLVTLREGESLDDADCDVIPGGIISGRITEVDPHGQVEISAYFCEACRFFAMERIEYRKAGSENEIRAAEEGWSAGSRTVNVEGNLQGVRIVLRYKGASILCRVDVIGKLPPNVRLMVLISSRIGKGGWSGWRGLMPMGRCWRPVWKQATIIS
jgi:hypothetical protein